MTLLSVTLTLLLFVPGAFGETYTFPDGSVYVGQLRNGVPHGLGKGVFNNGQIYEGEWKSGLRDGFGKYSWPDGTIYEGRWKDDKYDWFGQYVSSDGTPLDVFLCIW